MNTEWYKEKIQEIQAIESAYLFKKNQLIEKCEGVNQEVAGLHNSISDAVESGDYNAIQVKANEGRANSSSRQARVHNIPQKVKDAFNVEFDEVLL